MFKMQVQDDDSDPNVWHDVKRPDGSVMTFSTHGEARIRMEEMYPVLVKMERFAAGPKRTRVISILEDEDDWPLKPK